MREFACALHIVEVNRQECLARSSIQPGMQMNRMQRALTAFFFAASFLVSGVASAQVEAAPGSAVRGSRGGSLENLSHHNHLGALVFLLNGGFALLFVAFACFAAVRRHEPKRDHGHFSDWRSGNSVTSS